MTAFSRYWLLQIPGWVLLSGVLALAHRWFDLSLAGAAAILALWFVKDLVFYPLLAKHYELRQASPHVSFVGRRAVAREPLRPRGYIELNGQLWQARPVEEGAVIEAGERVEVDGIDGLTLLVRQVDP